jgi:hypothetical protein
MPLNQQLPDRNHGDQHVGEDHLFEMFVVSGVMMPDTPNIYLTLITV